MENKNNIKEGGIPPSLNTQCNICIVKAYDNVRKITNEAAKRSRECIRSEIYNILNKQYGLTKSKVFQFQEKFTEDALPHKMTDVRINSNVIQKYRTNHVDDLKFDQTIEVQLINLETKKRKWFPLYRILTDLSWRNK